MVFFNKSSLTVNNLNFFNCRVMEIAMPGIYQALLKIPNHPVQTFKAKKISFLGYASSSNFQQTLDLSPELTD